MIGEPLVFVATSDLAGVVRGKAFAETEFDTRLHRGVGWVPTNALITCFDNLGDGPYGSLGDLLLIPDSETRVQVDFEDGSVAENFAIGNIVTLDGDPWECCTRGHLAAALERLNSVAGLQLYSAFEHEFQLEAPGRNDSNPAFSMEGHRWQAQFSGVLFAALRKAGIEPDSFINEYGTKQYELPIGASTGIRSADEAIIFRQIVQATAERCRQRASFSPIHNLDGVGNGVHVHISFKNSDGQPMMFDPEGTYKLSDVAGSFIAGVLKYLPEFLCLTAPTEISYQRLTPHRWSAAFNNLGEQDREAAVRICPVSSRSQEAIARQFNVEFRAADAAASPYLVLAALVHAGVQGIEEKLPVPGATTEDLSMLDPGQLQALGVERLPETLSDALARFEHSERIDEWFGATFKQVYIGLKNAELDFLEGLTIEEKCAAYGRVF
ncbi:glutamine synthetase [Chromatiales bacterium (ex Bugula neritina AB1)]|nr:glutamine synthetase [Chromatiales bacterium (ex Bugula neritina AB1)]